MREDERQHLRNNILNRGFRLLPPVPGDEDWAEEYENRAGDIVVLDWASKEPEPAEDSAPAPFQICGVRSVAGKSCVSVIGVHGRHKGDHRSSDGVRWPAVVCGQRKAAPDGVRPRFSKPCLLEAGHLGDHRGEDGTVWVSEEEIEESEFPDSW